MYENALDTAYRLLMETEYDALGVTIEKIFQNCSGEWNAAIAKKFRIFIFPLILMTSSLVFRGLPSLMNTPIPLIIFS
ncbi:hypothetical protein EUCA11A_00230 [Eubacterium callanderi]|uniref:hypothetical protein n=1 Tax=Eubacterium callanderi TaxID=53442 RepID=UPI0029FF244D|nr:hypothetical protein [Eubacterium callanderi]WPK65903.1 hypothetical protein EUCA2A_00230 [Eubacterium callanderi]WPK70201.1 hypothetical protein EUCA11A_00230 [Eubacterium callanderi]